ncbi:hypothetical protein [Nonomuraea sp. NPDC049784]
MRVGIGVVEGGLIAYAKACWQASLVGSVDWLVPVFTQPLRESRL